MIQVNFHPLDPNCLISGSQDSMTKLFDLRTRECVSNFVSNMECIRDVQFSPHTLNTFASVSENGRVSLWDLRKPDRPEKNWQAHAEYVFALDWHPEVRT